jgi:peptidoglycan/LPS O-acetylase OafA/YrhL
MFVRPLFAGRSRPDLGRYSWRRSARIFPAYWVTLLVAGASWFGLEIVHFPTPYGTWKHASLSYLYFREQTAPGFPPDYGGLGVSWSLVVEITFYVFVPLGALALSRAARARPEQREGLALGAAIACIPIGVIALWVFAYRGAWAQRSIIGGFVTTFGGALPALGIGMVLAVLVAMRATRPTLDTHLAAMGRRAVWWWAGAALAFVIEAWPRSDFIRADSGQQLWQRLWQPVVAGLLVAPMVFAPGASTIAHKAMRNRPIAWIGTVSYGVYLWHTIVIDRVVDRHSLVDRGVAGAVVLIAVMAATSIAVAAASWYAIERPILNFAARQRRVPRPLATFMTRVAPWVLVGGGALFVFAPWIRAHALETHEGIDPYFRTQQLVEEIGAGNVPPQLLPDARGGAGTAFFRFYPPLGFAVAGTVSAVAGDNAVVGTNLSFVLAALAAALAMAWSVRRLGGDRWLAAGAALVYTAAPYHLLDATVRGALAEMWAFVWFPPMIAAAWRTIEDRRLDLALPVATAGLVVSHTISVALALFVIAPIALVAAARRDWHAVARITAGIALGLLLSAAFVIPQQRELDDVYAGDATIMGATPAALDAARVGAGDLVGRWQNAFRGYSHNPTVDGEPCAVYFCGADNFAVGPVLLALPIVVIGGALARFRRGGPVRDTVQPTGLGTALGLGAFMYVAFMLRPSWFSALLPSVLDYVQFPWRALAPLSAVAAIGWALLLRGRRRGGPLLVAIGVAGVLLTPGVQRNPVERPDQAGNCFTTADVLTPTDAPSDTCFRAGGEFDPPATGGDFSRTRRGALGYTTLGDYLPIATDRSDPTSVRTPIVEGDGTLVAWERTGDGVRATVEAREPLTVMLPASAFDFTKVTVAGTAGRSWSRADRDGFVGVEVPVGRHVIDVSRTRTRADVVAGLISVAAGVALAVAAIRRRTQRPGQVAPVPAVVGTP